jgi:HD-GYP domain-containing protein (c-di-GMP phosphodiesterase class II)
LGNIGLSQQSMDMAQTAFESSIDVFSKSKNIFELLNKTLSRKDYVVEHSIMASYFCYFIAKQMDWNNPKTMAKFNFAAIFHDSDLTDEKIAKIFDIQGIEFNNLSAYEKKMFLEHPVKASSVVRSLPNAPDNIDIIIMQHHEMPDGTGFPRKLDATSIAPMSCVFILAHYMTHYFYINGFTEDSLGKCLDHLSKNYDKGNFKKPLQGLLSFFATNN